MALTAGTRIGPYEITSPLGEGGMGVVYRAHDTKLGRDVAIKALPDAFANDSDRLQRFQREAQVLASLNHPNIAQIYGLEESDKARCIVMELVEGETLQERLKRGAIPIDEVLPIAKQIAEALEAAHEKGIIHRDLKPANIKVSPDGKVKVLDFGLAKALQEQKPPNLSNSPTLVSAASMPGVILGTAAYMSPEQAKGKQVDKRADIWSFGVVVYELLTGERLFKGDDTADTLAQVLTKEPDLGKVQPEARRLLARCLEKDPKKRLRDIGEAAYLLDDAPSASQKPDRRLESTPRKTLPWIATAVLTIALAGVSWVAWRATRRIEQPLKPLVQLDVDLGPDSLLGSPAGADVILSPDGTRLVYVSQGKLFTRRMDQLKAAELSGTEGAFSPFFSPDGQWVGFFAQGNLKKISVEGGSAIALGSAYGIAGASWGDDGNIIAALTGTSGLSRIPSAGGAPTPVTELAQGEITHRWPQVLPDGKAVLFTANTRGGLWDGGSIEVMTLTDRRRKTLQQGGTYGRYFAVSKGTGYLTYINNGTLFAVPFDLDTLSVRGTPSAVLQPVAYSPGYGSAQFDFSRNGTVVYRSGGAGGGKLLTVQWLDGTGKTQPLLAKPGPYVTPRLSPDGQRLALMVTGGSSSDIWIYEWQRDTMTRLTFGGGSNINPTWSPDGRYIAFEGTGGMFWIRSDGAGQPQQLTRSKNRRVPFSFAPDAKRLTFWEFVPGGTEIWTLPLEIDGSGLRAGKPEPFLQTHNTDRHPSFSPDGQWLAYDSDESGTTQVYVRAYPDKGGKWQVSNANGIYPEWSRSGRELFFRTEDNHIMVAAYTVKGDSFVADQPRVWSEKPIANGGPAGTNYSVAPDGKRIAALMPAEAPEDQKAQNHVIFLENFFDEVRRKVPPSKK